MFQDFVSIVVPRLVATALSVGMTIWALNGIVADSANATVSSLARAIANGKELTLQDLDESHQSRTFEHLLSSCDRESLRALVAVRLRELELSFMAADLHRADRAYTGAEAAIRRALSCAPLDGHLWLQLATLQTSRSGPSVTTFEYVRLSHWIAPSEGRIVRARVEFASRLFASGLKEVEPELRSDIRTLVSFDTPDSIADMFLAAPESVRAIYQEWIGLLSEGRRKRVASAVQRGGSNLNRE